MIAIFTALVPVTYVLFSLAEVIWPRRRLSPPPWSRVTGAAWFLVTGAIFVNAPRLWSSWAEAHRLLDLRALPVAGGAALCVLTANLLGYFWHRARHRGPLWRIHRLHHAAERLDVPSALAFHPLDSLGTAAVGSLTAGWLLGVSAEAAALAGWIGFVLSVLPHANLATPRWLGYLVQRPESHSVHHARGVHAFNYADLPVVDVLFGTFRNPRRAEEVVGLPRTTRSGAWALLALLLGVGCAHSPARMLRGVVRCQGERAYRVWCGSGACWFERADGTRVSLVRGAGVPASIVTYCRGA
jgi:sterol desaturase/sphingolipid hydroxylase (fatty acid hydroxylase superfamily)